MQQLKVQVLQERGEGIFSYNSSTSIYTKPRQFHAQIPTRSFEHIRTYIVRESMKSRDILCSFHLRGGTAVAQEYVLIANMVERSEAMIFPKSP